MKVLLLAENYPPRRGGIENYLFNITKYLRAGGVEVEVVEPSVQRFFWPLVRPKWLPVWLKIWRKAKRGEFEVVLCGKALFEGLVGYYLKKHLGIPYIVFTYMMEIDDWSARPLNKRKLVRVLKTADRVVYINDETKQKLKELGVEDKQLVKIWPGVGDEMFTSPPAPLLRNERGAYVLCISRLVKRKGVDLLIEAFGKIDQTRFSEVKLLIAGDGPERKNLEALAKKEWINTSVQFLGEIKDEELPALYASAQVFVLTPREAEGFGIVYIEAAAQGVPALATKVGGTKEAVLYKETGLVVQPKVAAITEGLEYLLSHEEERRKMGEKAKARAEDQFRWSKRIVLVKGMLDAVVG
jgi:phosphatidylinositol alpha-1,6-mannosyltransferase